MYMAYGWPQVIPIEPGLCPSSSSLSDRILFLRSTNRLLLVVAPTRIDLWSSAQHRVRIAKFLRDSGSVQREGDNVQAIWSPDTKTIAVLGLDYALMTGGDVAPLGSQAVTKIHQLFDWSKKSRRGLLLFIDEVDAFLCERNKTNMSEAQKSALNALLFRTGDQSKDIVLALATNRPGDLDSAVADRIDEVLEFPLPGEEERLKLLRLYLNKYITRAGEEKRGWFRSLFRRQQQTIRIRGVTEDLLEEAAAKTEGFSGREMAKLMASVQAAVYGSRDCELGSDLFREVVDYKVAEHQQRRELVAEGSA